MKLLFTIVAAGALMATSMGMPLHAQPSPNLAPSGRVTTSVSFDGRVMAPNGTWFLGTPAHSGPSRIIIDYGQPHARGRAIFGGLVPYGEVWRLGANWATSLSLDVPVRIGDLDVPRGEYTLFFRPLPDGGELIVNNQTRQWGTDYDGTRDFGRTSVRRRDLGDWIESLTITIVPDVPAAAGATPTGTLKIAWGEAEYSVGWRMLWPDPPL